MTFWQYLTARQDSHAQYVVMRLHDDEEHLGEQVLEQVHNRGSHLQDAGVRAVVDLEVVGLLGHAHDARARLSPRLLQGTDSIY